MSIIIKNLTYIYDEGMPFASKALDNISFEIKDRDFVGLIGDILTVDEMVVKLCQLL